MSLLNRLKFPPCFCSHFSTSLPGWFLLLTLSARAVTFEIDDTNEFPKIINTSATHVTNATVTGGVAGNPVESPVWIPSGGGYLVFSDCRNNKLKRIDLPNTVSDFYAPSSSVLCNGSMLDAQERLINCEAGQFGQAVVMFSNNVPTVICDRDANTNQFYSPNDLCIKSDGTIWFTDPGYNGNTPKGTLHYAAGYYVYRFNPAVGNASCVPVITSGLNQPNGICFSPDESKLYVAGGGTGGNNNKQIFVYTVTSSNTVTGGTLFATIGNGIPDGIRCDVDGRLWSSAGNGVWIYAPDGHLIGKILYGLVSNLSFGGADYHTLFMAGSPYVTSIPVLVTGMPSVKKLKTSITNGQFNVSWPAPSTGFNLQQSDQVGAAANWTASANSPQVSNAQNVVTLNPTNSSKFYRLKLN